ANRDVLSHLRGQCGDHVANRTVEALRVHELLLVEHVVLIERLDPSLDDAGDDVGGLALRLGMLGDEGLLLLDGGLVDLVAGHPAGVGPADVHGDVVGGLAELLALGHEVGLADQLDEHANDGTARLEVDVAADDALVGLAVGPLGHLGLAALAEQLEGGVEVAVGIGERLLGVHHPDTRLLAETLYVLRCDLGHQESSPSLAATLPLAAISLPSMQASAMALAIRSAARIASSFPAMTYSTGSGSELESTRAMIGIPRRVASATAVASVFTSMMKTASGKRCMSAMPPRFCSSLASSRRSERRSFLGRLFISPDSSRRRSSRM